MEADAVTRRRDTRSNCCVIAQQSTVVCGDSHSLAISATGELYSWGKAYAGRCGIADVAGMPRDDDVPFQPIPRHVGGGGLGDRSVLAVASGRWHNLAIVDDGDLYSWGAADAGRCGFTETMDMPRDEDNWPYQPVPRLVDGGALAGKKIVAIACGENHSLVVTNDGRLLAWGSLHMGRCGFSDAFGLPIDDENHPYQPVPREVVGGGLDNKKIVFVACGTFHSLAVTSAGELFAWGSACAGRCGFANLEGLPVDRDGVHYQLVPRQVVDGGMDVKKVCTAACSEGHSFAITAEGDLYAWGNADAGRCGLVDIDVMPADSDGPFQPWPALVTEGFRRAKVRSVACGSWHSLAVTQNDHVFAWGAARAGRCGFADISGLPCDENGPFQPIPRQIVDGGLHGKKIVQVACGSWHSLAVTVEGELFAWGVALMSRCGFDTTGLPIDDLCPFQPTPQAVVAMPKVKIRKDVAAPIREVEAVCADLRELLNDETYADVIFEVGGQELRAHIAILTARCDHFRCMFRSGMVECRVDTRGGGTGHVGSEWDAVAGMPTRRVCIRDSSSTAFWQLLVWLYTGSLDADLPTEELASILKLSDLYRLPALHAACQRVLSSHINSDTILGLLQVAIDTHTVDLELACLRYAVENMTALRQHASFVECSSAEVMRKVAIALASELECARDRIQI